jgi:hypothetical protein
MCSDFNVAIIRSVSLFDDAANSLASNPSARRDRSSGNARVGPRVKANGLSLVLQQLRHLSDRSRDFSARHRAVK